MKHLTFLIGASGAGKSTLARELDKRSAAIHCVCFDDILDEVGFWAPGEEESWQRRMTFEWCRRIATISPSRILLDGQTRYELAAEACRAASIESWDMVLVHCEDQARDRRLVLRGDPGLVNAQMTDWAAWLLTDARARGLSILDTTGQSLETSLRQLTGLLGLAE